MYQKLADNVAIAAGEQVESPAVSMEGANIVQVDAVLISVGSGFSSATITLEISNDLENWTEADPTDTTDQISFTTIGYKTATLRTDYASGGTRISAAYVRLRYEAVGGTAIFAAGINTASA